MKNKLEGMWIDLPKTDLKLAEALDVVLTTNQELWTATQKFGSVLRITCLNEPAQTNLYTALRQNGISCMIAYTTGFNILIA